MQLTIATTSEDQTIALGEAIGGILAPGDLLTLHGELGAGKTRLVRGVAKGAGADPTRVSSPTFIVMQEYRCAPGRAITTLVHADAYRLRGADELDTIGWDRIARDLRERRPVAVVIEWAERIDGALPVGAPRLDVRIEHAGAETHRRLTLSADDAWTTRPGWDRVARHAAEAATARPATRCPITGEVVPPDSPTYPFFDERARLADLGRWFSGSYRISREVTASDDTDAIPEEGV